MQTSMVSLSKKASILDLELTCAEYLASILQFVSHHEVQVQIEVVLFQGSWSGTAVEHTLNSIAFFSLYNLIVDIIVHFNDTYKHLEWLLTIPVVLAFLSAPLSGWLADAKFGNYVVFRAGAVLLFISTVINCLLYWSWKKWFGTTAMC